MPVIEPKLDYVELLGAIQLPHTLAIGLRNGLPQRSHGGPWSVWALERKTMVPDGIGVRLFVSRDCFVTGQHRLEAYGSRNAFDWGSRRTARQADTSLAKNTGHIMC